MTAYNSAECVACGGEIRQRYVTYPQGFTVPVGRCPNCSYIQTNPTKEVYDREDYDNGCYAVEVLFSEERKEQEAYGDHQPRPEPKADCRNCINAYNDGHRIIMCRKKRLPIGAFMSSAREDGCEHYKYSTVWGFERFGYGKCPECGAETNIKKNRQFCECGWSSEATI